MSMLRTGGQPKMINFVVLHAAIHGYKALSEMFQPLCEKGNHCLEQKTSVLIICCTFLVFLQVFTFSGFYQCFSSSDVSRKTSTLITKTVERHYRKAEQQIRARDLTKPHKTQIC